MYEIATKCRICGKDISSTTSGDIDIICDECKNAVKSMKEFLNSKSINNISENKKEDSDVEVKAKAFSILCNYFNFSVDARPDGIYLAITDNNVYNVSSYYDLTNKEICTMEKALNIIKEEKEEK